MVQELQRLGVSERLACRVVGLARSSFRHPRHSPALDDGELLEAVWRPAQQPRRHGYRRITALLQRQGQRVHAKRVWRIWNSEGLSLPRKHPRGRRQGSGVGRPARALKPNHVWTYDFLFDRTKAGQILKVRIVLDEYTRESLAIRVEQELKAGEVI
jgi:transposase InsO family protein